MGQDCCSNREKNEKDADGQAKVIDKGSGANPNEAAKTGGVDREKVKEKLGEYGNAIKNYDYKSGIENAKNYDYKKAASNTKEALVNYDYKSAA